MPKIQGLFQKFFIPSLFLLASTPAKAQITPDNTLGAEASSITPNAVINGANADLINGGAQRGGNLFHSFTEFNINDGQSVYFNNPSGVQNILSRVTGGDASNILGTLGVNGNANLFLINPNGILFGQNARLDVRGSFMATTANAVQFENQGIFSATNPQAAPLLTVNPSALLFNQINQNAAIQNNSVAPAGIDPAGFDAFGLRVPDGKSLLLVGGNVSMDGGELKAYGGRVELAGLSAPETVGLNIASDTLILSVPSDVQRGNISLSNGAFVNVSAAGRGDIAINARNLEISNSYLVAGIGMGLGDGNTKGGDININADAISLLNGAQIAAFTQGKGSVGNIFITARDAISLDSGLIANLVLTDAEGNAGNIDITTGSLSATNGAQINSFTRGRGNAGNITIIARDAVSFDGVDSNGFPSGSFINVLAGAVGNGGKITITASSLSLTNNGQLDVGVREAFDTIPAGEGIGGTVDINVRDAFTIGTNSGIFGSLGTGAIGRGGDIKVEAGNIFFRDGGEITSSTFGKGDSGNIAITARDAISLDKEGLYNNVQSSDAEGNAGNIDIITGSLSLTNGAQINSFTRGQGNAGNITIIARDAVTFDGVNSSNGFPSGSFNNVATGGIGNGGTINITSGSLSITNGGNLQVGIREASDALSGGKGIAGTLNINVRDALTISGVDSKIFSNLGSGAEGRGGDINILAGNVFIKDGAEISSSTFGEGDSGKIFITARDTLSLFGQGRSSIQNDVGSGGVGNSRGISINTGSLFLSDLALITSNVDGRGNSGEISIVARDLVSLDQPGDLSLAGQPGTLILSRVNDGGEGNSGDINIKTGSLRSSNSQITTSTWSKGNAGNVIIEAQNEVVLLRSTDIFTEVTCACETESGNGGDGRGGDIRITTGSLLVDGGSNLRADTEAKGDAGNIIINARDSITFSGSSEEFTSGAFSQVEPDGVGRGGDIIINTGNLSLSGDQEINTRTQGQGNAGNIFIDANSISLAGSNIRITSGASKDDRLLGTSGKGGDINITTNSLLVTDGAKLSANTEIQDAAGNININASRLTLNNRGSITSESIADANGGNIQLNVSDFLLMRRGAQISTTAGTAQAGGNGGNITINTPFIVAAPNENSDITANAFSGAGGNINIFTQNIFGIESRLKPSEQTNDITASSELGVQGQIEIAQPEIQPTQELIQLPNEFIDASTKFSQICPTDPNPKPLGKFIVTGRGSLPPSPLGLLTGTSIHIPLATLEEQTATQINGVVSVSNNPSPEIIEAQGWIKTADGEIALVTNAPQATPSSRPTAAVCPVSR